MQDATEVVSLPNCAPNPKGLNIVVYDLEIKEPIGKRGVTWDTHHLMGISVGVLFDYRTGDYLIALDDNLPEFVSRLNSADLVVGFNQIGFDNKLLRATRYDLMSDELLKNYDILLESRKALGWKPGDRFPGGCKLDNHLEAMFGKSAMKTGNGELAPELYQQGKLGAVISYCVADVKRTQMVFENIWERGWVKTLQHGLKFVEHPAIRMGIV